MQWMLEHATFLLNKFSVGRDGMTPFERATGRKWKRPLVEFGECVLAKMTLKKRQHGKTKKQKMKLAARSIYGTWVGQVARSGEHIVIKSSGDAVRCRTVRRIPKEKRWNAENVLTVEATPRCPAPQQQRAGEDRGEARGRRGQARRRRQEGRRGRRQRVPISPCGSHGPTELPYNPGITGRVRVPSRMRRMRVEGKWAARTQTTLSSVP